MTSSPKNIVQDTELTDKMQFLIDCLDNGNDTEFFVTWYKIFPSFVKYESEYKRLTLYAHVYFIIRTVNLSSECIDFKNLRSVRDFKRFLSQNELAYSDVEFTKYFMLPHQEEPRKDPLFSALFDDAWTTEFQNNMRNFLLKYDHLRMSGNELFQCESREVRYWKTLYDRLSRKFRDLHRDMELIMGMMSDITITLERSISDEEIDLSTFLENSCKIYPNLFKAETKILADDSNDEDKETIKTSTNETFWIRNLDIKKLKDDLLNASIKTKLLIMQALRLGITKTNRNESFSMVWLISLHDVLHFSTENTKFLKEMIIPSSFTMPNPTQQTVIRLLGALTTSKIGFNYVASANIVELLSTVVRNSETIETDKITSDLLISILQRISWVNYLGELMIKQNMLEWLIKKLQQSTEWNFCLRECLLFLMSLIRYQSAIQICISISEDLLSFLTKFLNGSFKFAENCECIFWKFCAFLENILSRANLNVESWEYLSLQFSLTNADVLLNFFKRYDNEKHQDFIAEIDKDDPLNVQPNGLEFLRLYYNLH